jgi:hypothetical protein
LSRSSSSPDNNWTRNCAFKRIEKEAQDKENVERQKMCELHPDDLILAGETVEDDDDDDDEEKEEGT